MLPSNKAALTAAKTRRLQWTNASTDAHQLIVVIEALKASMAIIQAARRQVQLAESLGGLMHAARNARNASPVNCLSAAALRHSRAIWSRILWLLAAAGSAAVCALLMPTQTNGKARTKMSFLDMLGSFGQQEHG
jgi:hypothetical protein